MWALSAFNIPILSGDTVITGWNLVLIHRQTSRATGPPKTESGIFKNLIEAFFAGLLRNLTGSGNNPNFSIISFAFSFYERGHHAEVFNAGVGTASNKYIIDRLIQQPGTAFQIHIF